MQKVILDGKSLTLEQVVKVARENVIVEISQEAKKRLVESRQLVFDLVDSDIPIYGFNVGVGWNKDKKVFKEFFEEYNKNLVLSHCVSVEPNASIIEARSVLLVRLNTLLVGCTGVSPEVAEMYADMLNKGITPIIPERGSVGEADIGCLSHIGLAMIGEGDVYYKGEKVNSKEAFLQEGLKTVSLGPKDGLAIVSSNALSAGQGAIMLYELKEFMEIADIIYAMSLEGLNGNTSPLNPKTHKVRPFKGQAQSAERISKFIEGSFIYEPDAEKPVQDPLCFRDTPHVHGAVIDAIEYTENLLHIQLNSSDDNPCLILDDREIISCANFEPLTWVLGFEMLGIAMSHISKTSCLRTLKLVNPAFTKLNRFLSKRAETICYGTIQKTYTILDAEIRHLSNPVSVDGFPLAGEIEDRSTNAAYVVQKSRKILDNLRYILAIELLHAAQALDYRRDKKFGKGTKAAYEEVRNVIEFYDYDRNLTNDINRAYNLIKSGKILDTVRKVLD